MSVNELAKKLKELEILCYPDTRLVYARYESDVYKDHSECSFTKALRDSVDKVLKEVPLVLLDSQSRHLEAQHSKITS
jgi:hypothetical protein